MIPLSTEILDEKQPAGLIRGATLAVLLLLLALVMAPSQAQPDSDDILVVGVLADFQPQYKRNSSGDPGGFAVESFDRIAAIAGVNYRYRVLESWDDMFASLRVGEIDVIPNMGITPQRQEDFSFTQPVESFQQGLFVQSAAEVVTGIESLRGRTVAAVMDNVGVGYLSQHPEIEGRTYQHPEQALFALYAGEIDGFVYPVPIAETLLARYQLGGQIRQAGPALFSIERAVAVKKGRKELLERLNLAAIEFLGSPGYEDIYLRWHADEQDAPAGKKRSPGLPLLGATVLLLIALVLLALIWRLSADPALRRGSAALAAVFGVMVIVFVLSSGDDFPKKIPRIAVVQLSNVDTSTYAGFLVRMKELDYLPGVDFEVVYKGPAGSIDRLDGLVREYLAMEPDLILVSSTPGTLAVKRLTEGSGIPVVFAPVNDPVDAGIVPSLKSPGDNITGVRLPTGDDLRLQLMSRILPQKAKVVVPFTPGDKSASATLQNIGPAAGKLGVELKKLPLIAEGRITGPDSVIPEGVDGIFLPRDSTIEARIGEFVALANERRLPLCVPSEKQVISGGLFSYGFVHFEIGRQAAQLVDQILRGSHPADLPVLVAENHLVFNMRTARRIGLEIPGVVLRQANRLID